MGYERPNYFDKNLEFEEDGSVKFRISETKTFGKPKWFDFVEKEYTACREKMGLCDYSSFTKIDLWVSECVAFAFLNSLLKILFLITTFSQKAETWLTHFNTCARMTLMLK